jgi:hypothetical protein
MTRAALALAAGVAWFVVGIGSGSYVPAVLGAAALAACALAPLPGRRDPVALSVLGVGAALLAVALDASDVVVEATPAEALFGACAGMLFAFGTGTAATVVAVPLLVAGIDLAAVLAGGDGIGRGDSGVLSLTLPGGPDVPALGLLDAVFLAAFAAWALDYDLRPKVALVALPAGLAVALVLAIATGGAVPTLPFLAAGLLVPSVTRLPHLLRSEG